MKPAAARPRIAHRASHGQCPLPPLPGSSSWQSPWEAPPFRPAPNRVSEELARFPIALAMRDGSIVELGEDGGCSLIDGTGKGWRGARPASFIDCSEVASVLIGDDIVIPVSEADK